MNENVCQVGGCNAEIPKHESVCARHALQEKEEIVNPYYKEFQETEMDSPGIVHLVMLKEHKGEFGFSRLDRVNDQRLVRKSRLVTVAYDKNDRWLVFVNNGFTSACTLSYKLRKGLCTCRDFQRYGRICKHLLAAVLIVNNFRNNGNRAKVYP